MPTEAAYSEIERLVARFKGLSAAARRAFNEDNTRKDFILPLFRALEWDTQNSTEVSAEEKVSRGWVDFSFRIGNVPRFFLETKRISEDLTKPQWVQQAMDYAWTKGVTWALLSDFEGLRVFNAEWKEDNPLRAQFIEFGVDSYLTDFERLWWLSRPEIAVGRLDHEAEKVGKKARREPVSQHLFDDLKTWRQILFKNLHAYNPQWTTGQIDEAVLRILNRLIFIRTAEDRQVERPRLQAILRELKDQKRSGQLLSELQKLWREFDATYDSQLFEMHRADILACASSPFEVLIEGLYGKQFLLYNFNAIDADVLGTAYEQYLGHVIAAPDAAEVLEKSAKRKSQGIFYTPTFVVKYIVQQTVGRYLDEHGYNPAQPIRVLDMACGSGSFLIESFDVLDRYVAEQRGDLASRASPATGEAEYDVHAHARQMELLTQCIYGVDKDEQAVAVARLNLLLKALHTSDKLPPLEHIRCGDSLISGAADELKAAFGPDWRSKRPFNWQEEFPEAFKDGGPAAGSGQGFDVIVGNPPYVATEMITPDDKVFLRAHTRLHGKELNLFAIFLERAIDLVREGGRVGFILPDSILTARSYQELRQFALKTCVIESIVHVPGGAFRDALLGNSVILVLRRACVADNLPQNEVQTYTVDNEQHITVLGRVSQGRYTETPDSSFVLDANAISFMERLNRVGVELRQIAEVKDGVKTGDNERFVSTQKQTNRHVKVLRGSDISRYLIEFSGKYLDYDRERLARPREESIFLAREKIIVRQTGDRIIAALDIAQFYTLDNTHLILLKPIPESTKYVLALLNSRLIDAFYQSLAGEKGRLYAQVRIANLERLPIRRIDFSDPAAIARHDRIVALVDEMLVLQRELVAAEKSLDDARSDLARRIARVDREIDGLVYELYGLTEEEIKIVEGK
jgi:type I restriction-modification system DNA methylase subunit